MTPLAQAICRRYRGEYPDEEARYGPAGDAWCVHDNQYLVAWAVEDLRFAGQFQANLAWLTRVLEARRFPLDRLARDLELAAAVVCDAVPDHADALARSFAAGAEFVRAADRDAPAAAERTTPALQKAYVAALLAGRPGIAQRAVERAVDEGLPVRTVYLEVLQPALYEIGDLWETGRATVAQEHLATASTEILLARLAPRLGRNTAVGRTAVVTGTAGELHALGTRFVSDFLEADGWTVVELGASMPPRELAAFALEHRPDLVALSTTLTTNLEAAATAIAALKASPDPVLVAVGGRAYGCDEAIARDVGADVFARDAAELPELLRRRLAG